MQNMASAPNQLLLIKNLEEALRGDDMAGDEELSRAHGHWRAALLELREEVDLGELRWRPFTATTAYSVPHANAWASF